MGKVKDMDTKESRHDLNLEQRIDDGAAKEYAERKRLREKGASTDEPVCEFCGAERKEQSCWSCLSPLGIK